MIPLLICALALAEWRITRSNLGAPWNGYGAIDGVLQRNTPAPMRYRVLAAWLLGWLPKSKRLIGYTVFKALLLACVLLLAYPLLGQNGTIVLAFLIAITLEFDYWDCYAELVGVLSCLHPSPWVALVGSVVWGLSRETVHLAPLLRLFAAVGNPWPAWAGVGAWWAVQLIQGRAGLYCERWTFSEYNVRDIKQCLKKADTGPMLALLWMGVTIAVAIWGHFPKPLASTWMFPLVWLGAGWLMGRAREVRIFLPCAIWIAGALI